MDFKNINRVEIIEKTKGREFTLWLENNKVELDFQDNNRTLKIFYESENNTMKKITKENLKKIKKEENKYIDLYFRLKNLSYVGTNQENGNVYLTFESNDVLSIRSVRIDAKYSSVYKDEDGYKYIKKSFPIDKKFSVYNHDAQDKFTLFYRELVDMFEDVIYDYKPQTII